MTSTEPQFQQVSGLWTAPVLESTSNQTVQMHVSIGVGAIGELADEEVERRARGWGDTARADRSAVRR